MAHLFNIGDKYNLSEISMADKICIVSDPKVLDVNGGYITAKSYGIASVRIIDPASGKIVETFNIRVGNYPVIIGGNTSIDMGNGQQVGIYDVVATMLDPYTATVSWLSTFNADSYTVDISIPGNESIIFPQYTVDQWGAGQFLVDIDFSLYNNGDFVFKVTGIKDTETHYGTSNTLQFTRPVDPNPDVSNLRASVDNNTRLVTLNWNAPQDGLPAYDYDIRIIDSNDADVVPYDTMNTSGTDISRNYTLGTDVLSATYTAIVRRSPSGSWREANFDYVRMSLEPGEDLIKSVWGELYSNNGIAVRWITALANERTYTIDILDADNNDAVIKTETTVQGGSLHSHYIKPGINRTGNIKVRVSADAAPGQIVSLAAIETKVSEPFQFIPSVYNLSAFMDETRGLVVTWDTAIFNTNNKENYTVMIVDDTDNVVAGPISVVAQTQNVEVAVNMGNNLSGSYRVMVQLAGFGTTEAWIQNTFNYVDMRPKSVNLTTVYHLNNDWLGNDITQRVDVPRPNGLTGFDTISQGFMAKIDWIYEQSFTVGSIKHEFELYNAADINNPSAKPVYKLKPANSDQSYSIYGPDFSNYRNIITYADGTSILDGNRKTVGLPSGNFIIKILTPGADPVFSDSFILLVDGGVNGEIETDQPTTTAAPLDMIEIPLKDNDGNEIGSIEVPVSEAHRPYIVQIEETTFLTKTYYRFYVNNALVAMYHVAPTQVVVSTGYINSAGTARSVYGTGTWTPPPESLDTYDLYIKKMAWLQRSLASTPKTTSRVVQTSQNAGVEIISIEGDYVEPANITIKLNDTDLLENMASGIQHTRGDFFWEWGNPDDATTQMFSTKTYSAWPTGDIIQLGNLNSKYGLITFKVNPTPPGRGSKADKVFLNVQQPTTTTLPGNGEATLAVSAVSSGIASVQWSGINVIGSLPDGSAPNAIVIFVDEHPELTSLRPLSGSGVAGIKNVPGGNVGFKIGAARVVSGKVISYNIQKAVIANGLPSYIQLTTTTSSLIKRLRLDASKFILSAKVLNTSTATVEAKLVVKAPVTASEFSASAVFPNTQTIISFDDGAGNYDKIVYIDTDGKLCFYINDGAPKTLVGPVLPTGQEISVAAVITSTEMRLLVNGATVASQPANGSAVSFTAPNFKIGGTSPISGAPDAEIRDVRVWNTERTDTQVQYYMNKKLVGTENNLAVYWRVDEGAGTSVLDYSPSYNNGTLSDASAWVEYDTATPAPNTLTAVSLDLINKTVAWNSSITTNRNYKAEVVELSTGQVLATISAPGTGSSHQASFTEAPVEGVAYIARITDLNSNNIGESVPDYSGLPPAPNLKLLTTTPTVFQYSKWQYQFEISGLAGKPAGSGYPFKVGDIIHLQFSNSGYDAALHTVTQADIDAGYVRINYGLTPGTGNYGMTVSCFNSQGQAAPTYGDQVVIPGSGVAPARPDYPGIVTADTTSLPGIVFLVYNNQYESPTNYFEGEHIDSISARQAFGNWGGLGSGRNYGNTLWFVDTDPGTGGDYELDIQTPSSRPWYIYSKTINVIPLARDGSLPVKNVTHSVNADGTLHLEFESVLPFEAGFSIGILSGSWLYNGEVSGTGKFILDIPIASYYEGSTLQLFIDLTGVYGLKYSESFVYNKPV